MKSVEDEQRYNPGYKAYVMPDNDVVRLCAPGFRLLNLFIRGRTEARKEQRHLQADANPSQRKNQSAFSQWYKRQLNSALQPCMDLLFL